jgi:hypothetical protein
MDKYTVLHNINTNFNKLFAASRDGITYVPLKFESSNDTEGIIVLSQILELMAYIRNTNDVSAKLTRSVLYHIITIRCKEFVDTMPWSSNYNNFIKSFEDYLNKSVDELNIVN